MKHISGWTTFAWMVVSMTLLLSLPSSLAAQTEVDGCTMKCYCNSSGCGCQGEGGNGSGCTASGNGCFVDKCGGTEDLLVVFAPDGSALYLRPSASGDATVNGFAGSAWEGVQRGHAVARDCRGLVAARYVDKESAAAMRAQAVFIGLDL